MANYKKCDYCGIFMKPYMSSSIEITTPNEIVKLDLCKNCVVEIINRKVDEK
jgi:hypothetical protein